MPKVTSGNLTKEYVIVLRHYGPYEDVNETWATLSEYAREHNFVGAQTKAIGIVYDDPTLVPAELLRYDACLTITATDFQAAQKGAPPPEVFDPRQPPDLAGRSLTAISGLAIRTETLPAANTVTIQYKGSHRNLRDAYTALLYSTADPAGKIGRTPPPYFEIYKNNPRFTAPTDLVTEIHIPQPTP